MRRLAWIALLLAGSASAQQLPGDACATAHPLATEACLEVLREGGNAFDAAVAASAAIAVLEPSGSGLGGGGFWLLHRAEDGGETFIDGRETAPMAASERMYQSADGQAVAGRSRDGALGAGIPGEPAALVHIADTYGRLPLAHSLQPAIRHAAEGFAVDAKLAQTIAGNLPRLSPAAREILAPDGQPLATGATLKQPDLARVLKALSKRGLAGFYEGEVAQKLVTGIRAAGGIWTAEDLQRYRVVERLPLQTRFRGYRIVTAPPPSAGGIGLAQIFQQLEALGWTDDGSLRSRHLMIEAMRRAYRDRAAWLGDPDFVRIPLMRLTSRSHALQLASGIRPDRATPSAELPPPSPEGGNTTHISVIDREGNRVAATLSINLPFGSGFVAPGTGLFLNDEMDDFSAAPAASNAYGLIGSRPNRVEPGKRPLSSMTPTFVEGPRGALVIGTPGGSRIITMVALGILGWIDGLPAAQVAALPRYHHQYLPDAVSFEPQAFTPEQQAQLTALGHKLVPPTATTLNLVPGSYGNLQLVSWEPRSGKLDAAADPRAVGLGKVQPR
ncbi:MAG TPA: gamma-glutamyltransferase [Solimonas sp.]|nr:gamma-glutamyltransferase [Solimonas sp.]